MLTIGLIGGLTWESTATYYRLLNERLHDKLGGHHSARIALFSFDFADVEVKQRAGDWRGLGEMVADAALAVEAGGADFLLIGANTMHEPAIVAAVRERSRLPLLHIIDPLAEAVRRDGLRTVGLLGTAYTMERPFYRERLEAHGLDVVVPEAADRAAVHQIIFDELVHGIVREESRRAFADVVGRLCERGAQAAALSCTEFGLLVPPGALPVPSYDTTELHAIAAVDRALGLRGFPTEPGAR